MLRSSETGNHPNSFVDCNSYLATLKAMSCENCFCRDFPAVSKLDCYRFLGRPCADGMMELVESVPGVARVETAESAEIASIRSDFNRVLKLVEPGSKRKAEGLCWYHAKLGVRSLCRQPCSFPARSRKRQPQPPVATQVIGGSLSHLPYVTEQRSNKQFLISTGTEVCVFPLTRRDKLC